MHVISDLTFTNAFGQECLFIKSNSDKHTIINSAKIPNA